MLALSRMTLLVALTVLAAGCEFESVGIPLNESEQTNSSPVAATNFDPARCGSITGQLTWNGPVPITPGFLYGVPKGDGSFDVKLMPNPNRPGIDTTTRAVAGAVVFLRGVKPTEAKPWELAPVRVEMKDRQIHVRQGDGEPRRVGFVRCGDAVTMESAEPVYHILRGRGAAFFSYTFPDANQPMTRTFRKPGRVELSSGAGYYWANADLFVCEHPYFTVTDRDGRFTLDSVPAGEVEVVAWLPGWEAARQERDPESGLIFRQTYSPPVEVSRKAGITAGQPATTDITIP